MKENKINDNDFDLNDEKPNIDEMLGVNPFIQSLEIIVSAVPLKDVYEKAEDGIILRKEIALESIPYVKLYQTVDRREIVMNLSDKAQRLLLWIMFNLKPSKDYIYINTKRYMTKNNIKAPNTFINAKKELIRYGLISTTVIQQYYWINPDFFFNGSRINKFKKNLKFKS